MSWQNSQETVKDTISKWEKNKDLILIQVLSQGNRLVFLVHVNVSLTYTVILNSESFWNC